MANGKYSFKDATRGRYLGEIHESLAAQLNADIVPQALTDLLASHGIVLGNARVRAVRRGVWRVWRGYLGLRISAEKTLSDGRRRLTFHVFKENYKDETDMNGAEIVGSCFYQEAAFGTTGDPSIEIFPSTMTGVTFRRCNLDNVIVPPGNTIIMEVPDTCSHRRIRCQNDLEDWVLDSLGNPVEPVAIKLYRQLGLSTDPRDIPDEPLKRRITEVD